MVQRTWRNLVQHELDSFSYICASKAQYDMIETQLDDVPIILEPMRRDTFPAIALASSYLFDKGITRDEVIIVMPIDHMVEDHYYQEIKKHPDILIKSDADIALIGVHPTEPSSQFGYITVQNYESLSEVSWHRVEKFIEKPASNK